jgi:Ca2+-binding RTX toxin-like protein
MEGDDRLDGGAGADTYVLGLHSGLDTIEDAAGIGTLVLERGLRFDDLTRERDGADLVVRLRGSEQTGVRIAGYYVEPSDWRVLTETGVARTIDEIAETAYWGDAADPVAQAEADYLDALRADFLERMDWFGYTRGASDTVEHLPVAATVANYRYSTVVTVTDYATGTISQQQYGSVAGPDLERVRYGSGDEAYTYWDTITGQRVHFVIESVPLEGNYVYAKRWFQQTTQATGGQLWLTPQKTTVEQLAPEAYQSWQTVGTPLPNGVSGVRLTNETTLTAVTRMEGALGATGTMAFPYTLYDSDFIVERLTGTDQDDGLYTGRATHTILEGGGGNDTLRSIGNWSWGSAGLFFDGGPGSDRITGGIHGDRITGGADGDYLNGSGGADHYLVDTTVRGFDLINDTGSLWVDLETGWSAYKSWYYGAQGLDPNTLQSQVFRGPALPAIPRADATDYAALEPFLASGYVPLDEVELSGVRPQDLVLSWGYDSQPGYYGGLRATLNLSWGDADSGVRIVLPPPPSGAASTQSFTPWVQPDWFVVERGVGLGIERFRFGSGEVLSMAELLALAPPAPLHPQEVLTRLDGTTGADHLVAAAPGGWLLGGAGDDVLDGSASPDVIEGGAGNDALRGGAGSDLYLFDTGDGHDLITEAGKPGEIDVIQLGGGPDVLTTDVLRSGNDLVLRFDDLGNGVTIRNWYADPAARVEQVVFEEGWVWDSAELERRAVVENLAPVATDPAPVAVSEAKAFRVTVPATTFVDPEGETALRVTATLADGTALPSWLGFDAATLAFSGTPPLDASGVYQIALTATDSLGASAQAFLDLEVLDVNPPLTGQDAGEVLVGTAYPDWIDGGRGDDRISGGAGDDLLIGGLGADVLDGSDGDDRLVFTPDGTWLGDRPSANLGSPRSPSGGGSVPLAGRAASSDVFIGGAGVDTLVGTDGSDSVLLDAGLGASRRPGEARISGVERFELGAGDDLLNLTSRRHAYGDVFADGGDGDDVLWASAGNDRLLGGGGSDALDGGAGNDELLGGEGTDRLDGATGDDLLVGGAGDDRLAGGRGSDTYRYALGDGADVISEQGSAKETDRLVFEGDITADRLWFRQAGDDLVLGVTGTEGSVAIEGWYADASRRVDEIVAGDGSVLLAGDVDRLVAAMAVFDVQDASEIVMPLGSVPVLAPVIAAAWQPAVA